MLLEYSGNGVGVVGSGRQNGMPGNIIPFRLRIMMHIDAETIHQIARKPKTLPIIARARDAVLGGTQDAVFEAGMFL